MKMRLLYTIAHYYSTMMMMVQKVLKYENTRSTGGYRVRYCTVKVLINFYCSDDDETV
jgi:hypothetical protein